MGWRWEKPGGWTTSCRVPWAAAIAYEESLETEPKARRKMLSRRLRSYVSCLRVRRGEGCVGDQERRWQG